jgi:TRAP-type C4-dicarboxylate transport system substrate-binding protein
VPAERTVLRIGGYAPRDSSHGGAVAKLGDTLAASGLPIEVDVRWNILDEGRPAGDLLGMVEAGELTLCYFSTSYLCGRVPELAVLDLPYRFATLDEAHAALDGRLGRLLTARTEAATGFAVLGYWDNGFRHLTNRVRPVRSPGDCEGLRIRLQPSRIHERMAELWGAIPVPTDLAEGIAMLRRGEVDAQENPLGNTFAYGIDALHPYVTMTGHVYGARGLYAHRATVEAWPAAVRDAVTGAAREAIAWQREDAAAREGSYRLALERGGAGVIDLTPAERAAFAGAVRPLHDELRRALGDDLVPSREQ